MMIFNKIRKFFKAVIKFIKKRINAKPEETKKESIGVRIADMAIKVADVAVKTVVSFAQNCYNNAEAVVLLLAASFGFSALLGRLPLVISIPLIIGEAMLIPVLSVAIVWLLLVSIERRATPATE